MFSFIGVMILSMKKGAKDRRKEYSENFIPKENACGISEAERWGTFVLSTPFFRLYIEVIPISIFSRFSGTTGCYFIVKGKNGNRGKIHQ